MFSDRLRAAAARERPMRRLAVEVAKVAGLEEAAMKQVEESSTKLREGAANERKMSLADVTSAHGMSLQGSIRMLKSLPNDGNADMTSAIDTLARSVASPR